MFYLLKQFSSSKKIILRVSYEKATIEDPDNNIVLDVMPGKVCHVFTCYSDEMVRGASSLFSNIMKKCNKGVKGPFVRLTPAGLAEALRVAMGARVLWVTKIEIVPLERALKGDYVLKPVNLSIQTFGKMASEVLPYLLSGSAGDGWKSYEEGNALVIEADGVKGLEKAGGQALNKNVVIYGEKMDVLPFPMDAVAALIGPRCWSAWWKGCAPTADGKWLCWGPGFLMKLGKDEAEKLVGVDPMLLHKGLKTIIKSRQSQLKPS